MVRLALVLLVLTGTAHADDVDPLYLCKTAAPGTKLRASFRPDTSLFDLATWVMGFSCKNVVFSSEVTKHATRVTVLAPNEMTPKQAMQLFVDAVESTGLVVVQKADTIIIELGPNTPASCPDVAVAPPPAPSVDDVVKALDAGIKQIDDSHFDLTARAVDFLFHNPLGWSDGARLVPAVKDGKTIGFRVYAIRPGSIFARLNLVNGDTVLRVNGYPLTSADRALDAWTKLHDVTPLVFDIERRGKTLSLYVTIR